MSNKNINPSKKRKKINSKTKGANYEREISNFLKNRGYESRRTQQYCGAVDESSDVIGLDGIHIECKHYAKTGFSYNWLNQAKRDTKNNNIPVVFHRIDRQSSVVTMDLEDFMLLYEHSDFCKK